MERQRATVYRDRKTDRYGGQGKAIRRTSDASPPSVWDVRVDDGLADVGRRDVDGSKRRHATNKILG